MTGNSDGLAAALAKRVDGEVRFDAGSRAAYAFDASNYRQVPIGVVLPRNIEAAVRAECGLWPAVAGADAATAILADGFSCRTQIEAGNLGRKGIHLAQLLARQAGLTEASGS